MLFEELQSRLVAHIRERVRCGEWTERSLARATGISQPHIHNVLKGARILSPEIADRVMSRLRISMFELLAGADLGPPGPIRPYSEVPLLNGWLGPGHAFPVELHAVQRHPFPAAQVSHLSSPVMVRLADDLRMMASFRPGDLVLLDRATNRRSQPDPDGYYAVDFHGEGVIRRIRLGSDRLYVVADDNLAHPSAWDCISLGDRNILEVVKAKVVWIGRHMERVTAPE